jgi:hypothetical protein
VTRSDETRRDETRRARERERESVADRASRPRRRSNEHETRRDGWVFVSTRSRRRTKGEPETKGGEARVAVVSSGVKPSTDVGGFVERRDDVGERERAGKRRGTEEVFVIFE